MPEFRPPLHLLMYALFRIASLTQIVFYDLYLGIYFSSAFYAVYRMRMYLFTVDSVHYAILFSRRIFRGWNEMGGIFLCSHQSCIVDILIELS